MAAIRITVFYTPHKQDYEGCGSELDMIESDIESLECGGVTIDEFIGFADEVIYDPMPGITPA